MLQNCYHSQGINKGRQLEQGGFSLKTHLPLSCKKQIPHSLTFVYNFSNIFTIQTIFWMPSQWGFLFVFLVLRAKLLNCQLLKQREFEWMKERVKCYTHSLLCRYCRYYEATSNQIDLPWQVTCMDLHELQQCSTVIYYK